MINPTLRTSYPRSVLEYSPLLYAVIKVSNEKR
ncbi:hypothetical protein FB480_101806 [Agrobacterium vitis]|nr:hypothetical protein FB480_101806 [Agrobacterium vitis]